MGQNKSYLTDHNLQIKGGATLFNDSQSKLTSLFPSAAFTATPSSLAAAGAVPPAHSAASALTSSGIAP